MCGRTQLLVTWDALVALYRILPEPEPTGPTLPLAVLPRWSVAPTQPIPGVRFADGQRTLSYLRWGYPMMWLARKGKNPWGRPLINAKAEEASDKRTWSASLRDRRCVVPATGFYEWVKSGKKRFPVELSPTEGQVMHIAGIWQTFEKDGVPVDCVSLLTTAANPEASRVHDRMPVLLSEEGVAAWLDPSLDAAGIAALTQPAPAGTLKLRPVSTKLNHWSASGDDMAEADWSPGDGGAPSLGE